MTGGGGGNDRGELPGGGGGMSGGKCPDTTVYMYICWFSVSLAT